MAITNYANAFETTLTASLSSTGLVLNVASTTGAPSFDPPGAWLVIDHRDSNKREIVKADGGSTSNTITISDLANRYGEGSASPSGITHDEGATVIGALTKQLLDEFVTEINSVTTESHTHVDNTDGYEWTSKVSKVNGEIDSYSEPITDLGNTNSFSLGLNSYYAVVVDGAATLNTFTGVVPSNRVSTIVLRVRYSGATNTLTVTPTVNWPGQVTPVFNSGGASSEDIIVFQRWADTVAPYGFLAGPGMDFV